MSPEEDRTPDEFTCMMPLESPLSVTVPLTLSEPRVPTPVTLEKDPEFRSEFEIFDDERTPEEFVCSRPLVRSENVRGPLTVVPDPVTLRYFSVPAASMTSKTSLDPVPWRTVKLTTSVLGWIACAPAELLVRQVPHAGTLTQVGTPLTVWRILPLLPWDSAAIAMLPEGNETEPELTSKPVSPVSVPVAAMLPLPSTLKTLLEPFLISK